jgi:hypothetical protein
MAVEKAVRLVAQLLDSEQNTPRRESMRRFCLAIAAAAALLSAMSLMANRAEAMTLPAPAGLQLALEGNTMIEEVARVCRRRCGPRGCWRRCGWAPGPRYYGGYYAPYYYGRPYRRWGW